MKKTFLFVTLEGGGNVPAVLGLAKSLSARGHRVRVLTEPCMQELIESSGMEFIPFQKHFTKTDRTQDMFGDWKASGPSNPSFDTVVFGPAAIVAEETYAALQAVPTDVLIADLLMPAAMIAAEALNIPRVMLFHMPEYLPGNNRPPGGLGVPPMKGFLGRIRDRLLTRIFYFVMNKYLPLLNEVRKTYGLSPLKNVPDMFHEADLRIIQTSASFDFPLEPAPANVRYAGPVLDDPDWAEPWQSPWASDDPRPLVVVSLSSTFQNQKKTLERCIEALGQLDARGLVTLGPAMANESFEVPENVVLLGSASHAQVFPHADAVVTHGGHGTLMRALAHDLPIVCLPMGRDQGDNAVKVQFHGAGLKLSSKAKPAAIQQAIGRVLEENSFQNQAARLGKLIREEKGREEILEELEALVLPLPAVEATRPVLKR